MNQLLFRPRTVLRSCLAATLACAAAVATAPSPAFAQLTGTVSILHSFTGTDGNSPLRAPIKASDGNYYGVAFSNSTSSNAGTVYKLTAAGTLTVLHTFATGTDGSNPEGSAPRVLIQGADGNLYGICRSGGAVNSTPAGAGTFFRVGLDGTFAKLYDFDNGKAGEPRFPSALVQGSDGNFYGLSRDGGSTGLDEGTYFRLTPGGAITELAALVGGDGPGYRPEAQLIVGSDGNFYGVTTAGGNTGGTTSEGTIFQATQAGTITKLHAFDGGSQASAGGDQELVQGSDGLLYGVSPSGGTNQIGDIYRCATDGSSFVVLHNFVSAITDGKYPGALTQGADGNFYGATILGFPVDTASTTDDGDGSFFQINPGGIFTTLAKTQGTSSGPTMPTGKLTLVSGTTFYGATSAGGASNDGTVVSLVVTYAHPAFFTGEVALSNGVYYLSFSNGNYFGYYSYLTDPRYIYHQDLGYEYTFDAADGKSGIYFYDFKSGGYFYTSPTFPFPYLYDFTEKSVVYYYPDPNNPGHYNTDGYRFFYVFSTGTIISK